MNTKSMRPSRRDLLQLSIGGAALAQAGALPALAARPALGRGAFGRAKNVIVMYCWGGMSHIDTFDMKPDAGSEIRGEFQSIATTAPGLRITEHLPLMARMMQHVTVVRSVHHKSADHRKAAYWNLTGHPPMNAEGGVVAPTLPSRKDWPGIGAQVAMAMRNDRRYQQLQRVQRLTPEEAAETQETSLVDVSLVNWKKLRVVSKVSMSTDVLGPGHFSTGAFDKQDGYTNNGTVELICMFREAAAAAVPLTRRTDGPTADFSKMLAGDGTAGDWGSDTHGRSGNLWLIGDREPNVPHVGFGCHANKFITFNMDEVRKKHFAGTANAFVLTFRVGINGDPGVAPSAVGQAGVWIDGEPAAISRLLRRDERSQKLETIIRPTARFLTLAMLNGDGSTYFDDIAMRDVDLHEVEGELPDPPEELSEKEQADLADVAAKSVTEDLAANLPRTISIPYPLADRGLLNGQFGGFLGLEYDPVFVHPGRGAPFRGISPNSGSIDLTPHGVSRRRLAERALLLDDLGGSFPWSKAADSQIRLQASQDQAINMLLSPEVQSAFDLSREKRAMHELYGDHVAGQSALLGRRLTDAGIPLVTVNLSVGDLNGASGDNWDTHGNNFNRLKNDLLPPWDRAASALLQDLVSSGKIEDTLVVFLTEFGRTPRINGNAGRDHFPNCYTVLFAGAGVAGGQILGKSDKLGARPIEAACTPEDIHATIFHALGIAADFKIHDPDNRPLMMCEGKALPIFGA